MRRFIRLSLVAIMVFALVAFMAINVRSQETPKVSSGPSFIDEDGDGIHDYAWDSNGDGIPNGCDPDWQRPPKGNGWHLGPFNNPGRGHKFGLRFCALGDFPGKPFPKQPAWITFSDRH
ncbi:MAG: hypothetical protein ONB05_10195 [candidate division KSB1 bacterium]|nr:hypothetical protein [candidate division KSB1 bacterium]